MCRHVPILNNLMEWLQKPKNNWKNLDHLDFAFLQQTQVAQPYRNDKNLASFTSGDQNNQLEPSPHSRPRFSDWPHLDQSKITQVLPACTAAWLRSLSSWYKQPLVKFPTRGNGRIAKSSKLFCSLQRCCWVVDEDNKFQIPDNVCVIGSHAVYLHRWAQGQYHLSLAWHALGGRPLGKRWRMTPPWPWQLAASHGTLLRPPSVTWTNCCCCACGASFQTWLHSMSCERRSAWPKTLRNSLPAPLCEDSQGPSIRAAYWDACGV